MRLLPIISLLLMFACSGTIANEQNDNMQQGFTEKDVWEELNRAWKGEAGAYFPKKQAGDIQYNFFLDLEHGYCETAGSRIHLYADSIRWAIVFEKSGYQNRAGAALIQLDYVGNCIDYHVEQHEGRNFISNSSNILLIDSYEFARIENKEGKDLELFELIGKDVKEISVRDKTVPFISDYSVYEKAGIKLRDYDNPNKLVGFGDYVRFLHETNPSLISATDDDIRQHIPKDIPKLMTIDKFHYISAYDESSPPGSQETYQLIAKVLVTRDTTNWRPTGKPNNHWSRWESGNL